MNNEPINNPFHRRTTLFRPEPLPEWLRAAGVAPEEAHLDLRAILTDSLYYPACGLNGTPIKHFSGFVHSFVYADYLVNEEQFLGDIHLEQGIIGYDPVLIRKLNREDVVEPDWQPSILPPRESWATLQERQRGAQPFGNWSIWKRNTEYG